MMAIIGLIIAVLAAYWVFTDARKLGYSGGVAAMWSLGTFLILIVFLPLYLIFGRRTNPARQREEKVIDIEGVPLEDVTYCPMCGGKVKEEYKTCPFCGFTLRPKCEQCGQELRREWQNCPNCAAPVNSK